LSCPARAWGKCSGKNDDRASPWGQLVPPCDGGVPVREAVPEVLRERSVFADDVDVLEVAASVETSAAWPPSYTAPIQLL